MLSKKNLDELNNNSRAFYERALMKMNLSLVFAAFAFMFLGFCSQTATRVTLANNHPLAVDDDQYKRLEIGYGFAAFFHILGFLLSSAVSMYLSPLIGGTKTEGKILSTPQNIDGSDAPSAPSAIPSATAVPDLYAGYPEPQSALNKI